MAKKKKKKIIRQDPPGPDKGQQKSKTQEPAPEKPRLPERIKEKDSGFGVIKVVVGVIIALVLGSTVLFNKMGGRESLRGHKGVGERCDATMECETGTICYDYQTKRKHCMRTCYNSECPEGYSCVAAATQKRRKGVRITDVCVRD